MEPGVLRSWMRQEGLPTGVFGERGPASTPSGFDVRAQ